MVETTEPTYHAYFKDILSKSRYSQTGNQGLAGLEQAKKVILDVDPGGDDAQAMILAFHLAKKHDLQVIGVTTVSGNAILEHVVLNSQMVLHACQEAEVPIYKGEDPRGEGVELCQYFYGPDGFGNTLLEWQREHENVIPNNVKTDETAVEYLIRVTKEQPGEITIIGLAPLTNLAVAQQKDSDFAKNVKNIVLLGGTYLAQGNTDFFSSEFNFFKDPLAAKVVFDNFKDITMVPIEASRVFRSMPDEVIEKPFIQTHTVKGKLVHDSFRIAHRNLGGKYETNDPLAVAVAMQPDTALEVVEKCCYIETEGKYTKGMVIVDWFEAYGQRETEGLNSNPRHPVKIVAKIKIQQLLDMMLESVL